MGGPIIKNKTFYFIGFEKQEYIIGLSGLATEPSTAWVTDALALLNAHGVAVSPISQNMLGLFPEHQHIAGTVAVEHRWSCRHHQQFLQLVAIDRVQLQRDCQDRSQLQREEPSIGAVVCGAGQPDGAAGNEHGAGDSELEFPYYFEKAPIHVQNYSVVLNSVFQRE